MSSQPNPAQHPMVIAEDRIIRYTFRERLVHWLAGLTYLYLLMSGLALYSPYLYWMAAILGGGPTVRFWHPWIGLVFSIAVLWMHAIWRGEMRTTSADLAWRREVKKYIENRDD